jgi:iron complex outermembrane receptor protein
VENAPASVTIVTAEQIERFGYRTLAEVLQSVRGFYISNDRNYTYVGVRGFSRPTDYNNRVVLLLNGQILNENYYNSTYVGSEMGIPLNGLERIEIVRGPGSALYGTGAMFSVINLVTPSGEAEWGGHGHVELGSRGHRAASATAGNRAGALDFIVSAGWGESDGADQYYPEFDDPATTMAA